MIVANNLFLIYHLYVLSLHGLVNSGRLFSLSTVVSAEKKENDNRPGNQIA
jgi:hypothetical protein